MPKKKEGQEVVEPERDKGTTAEKKEEPEEIEQEIKKEEDIASSSDDGSSRTLGIERNPTTIEKHAVLLR